MERRDPADGAIIQHQVREFPPAGRASGFCCTSMGFTRQDSIYWNGEAVSRTVERPDAD